MGQAFKHTGLWGPFLLQPPQNLIVFWVNYFCYMCCVYCYVFASECWHIWGCAVVRVTSQKNTRRWAQSWIERLYSLAGGLSKSCNHEPYCSWPYCPWLSMYRLTNLNKNDNEQNYRSQKTQGQNVRDFSRSIDYDRLGFWFSFGRHWGLRLERCFWYGAICVKVLGVVQ